MKKNHIAVVVIIFSFLLLSFHLWKNYHTTPVHIYTQEEQEKINSTDALNKPVEFIYLEQEQLDIAKWKDKTMDDLIEDAKKGDRAALHNLGDCFFLGLDCPIDVQVANIYFSESASLGFAPSLNQIAQMYINDESNGLLGLVYTNLTISFGHTELIQCYHEIRRQIINSSANGKRIVREIESLAMQKEAIILRNQKYVQDERNDNEIRWLSLENITDEDYQYDNDYWMDVYNGDNEVVDLSEIKGKDEIYFDRLYRIFYQFITSEGKNFEYEIQQIVNEMKNDLYSDSDIVVLAKQAKFLAKSDYKYSCKITRDAKMAKNNLKILKKYQDQI